MTKRGIVIVCGTALLIAAAVVVALREWQPLPEVLVAVPTDRVRVKAVERKDESVAQGESAAATDAVAIVCGWEKATADRCEVRNGAHTSSDRFRGSLRSGDIGDRVLPVGKRSARVGVH